MHDFPGFVESASSFAMIHAMMSSMVLYIPQVGLEAERCIY